MKIFKYLSILFPSEDRMMQEMDQQVGASGSMLFKFVMLRKELRKKDVLGHLCSSSHLLP